MQSIAPHTASAIFKIVVNKAIVIVQVALTAGHCVVCFIVLPCHFLVAQMKVYFKNSKKCSWDNSLKADALSAIEFLKSVTSWGSSIVVSKH